MQLAAPTLLLLAAPVEAQTSTGKAAVGVPGNKVRLVLLNGNDPFIGWIGLMQYFDPPLPTKDPGPSGSKPAAMC